jgi:hypothetical protein
MSASDRDIDISNARQAIRTAANPESGIQRTQGNADLIYDALTRAWGMPSFKIGAAERATPTSAFRRKLANEPDEVEERYGTRSPFVTASTAGSEYDTGDIDANGQGRQTRDAMNALAESADPSNARALVDETIIGDAAPVDVDPVIFNVLNNEVPELNIIEQVAQPGFEFKYNVISDRDAPIGMLSESEAAGDLEDQFTPQSFTLSDETISMKRQVGLFKVSDFSQRAMTSLDYMDPRETTLGQGTIAHNKFKVKQMYYGDPSVGAGDQSIEDADAFEGLAKIADDAGNSEDKSDVSSGILEDLLDELTDAVVNTGLTFDRARFMVSQSLYNQLYDEQTPVIRIDGYEADVEYGPRGISLSTEFGTAPITPTPNIQAYGDLTGVGSNASLGDVFLIDELATQFRQLAPMSTVPLGRTGLADRVSMFEYYTLVDRSQGNHTFWLQDYDI